MKTLIAIAASLLAATVITAGPSPHAKQDCLKHYAPFPERFGDWDRSGRIQANACQLKWPAWQVVCAA